MSLDWDALTAMTNGKEFTIAKVKLKNAEIAIEGDFELPPLAKLPYEDQVFVAMFVKSDGSIKEMEQAFGISYPTVKARLSRISEKLSFVNAKPAPVAESTLDLLERGEITVKEALKRLKS